jgi:FdhD protein
MGYEIARQVGITMIGRATGKHYLLFTGAQRFVRATVSAAAIGV